MKLTKEDIQKYGMEKEKQFLKESGEGYDYDDGYNDGYSLGYEAGYEAGYQDGKDGLCR
jgi:flagellar biosynthesis/type III secretory pathway protein FliH